MTEWNYFNYFTEIEEYFWKKRGAHLLVSPLDWAIMETWQKAGVPLEAVLKGIDRAFESYGRSRRGTGKPPKSLAYCTDAVLQAAEEAQEAAAGRAPARTKSSAGFKTEEVREYLRRNKELLQTAARAPAIATPLASLCQEACHSVESIVAAWDSESALDLEDLERRLTLLDEKIHAGLLLHAPEDLLLRLRREMDGALSAYRRRMPAGQLALIEKQYLQKRLLEEFRMPRLSLFYLM
jgi:hypothetical protein